MSESSTALVNENTFEHVNLAEVDPSAAPIAEGTYNFQVTGAELKEFTYKKGDKVGQTGERIAFKFVIVDSDKYSGRLVFESLFASSATQKMCRILMDNTGISQSGTFKEWLAELVSSKATFSAPIAHKMEEQKPLEDGTPVPSKPVARINLWKTAPAN